MAVFGDGDEVRVEARDRAVRFLLVSGKPLGEPIARYGPFVMNTREELQLALLDLQNDRFVWRDDAGVGAQPTDLVAVSADMIAGSPPAADDQVTSRSVATTGQWSDGRP